MTKTSPRRRASRVSLGVHEGTPVVFVELTRGCIAAVEPEDWRRVSQRYGRLWSASVNDKGRTVATTRRQSRTITLSRAVMGAGEGERVVALNDNPLDCRRANLHVSISAHTARTTGRPQLQTFADRFGEDI